MRWPGASQAGAAALLKVFDRLVREGIETAVGDALLELAIPRFGVELRKPIAEHGEFLAGELGDCLFQFLDGVYGM